MRRDVYLDYAATTPVDERVVEAMHPVFTGTFGNPNSLHLKGREAYRTMEDARESIMSSIGVENANEVVFTGGGTEADNAAVLGVAAALRERKRHIVVSAFEHHAVLEPARRLKKEGWELTELRPRQDGVVDPQDLAAVLRDDTALVSVMTVNNELGTVQPVAELARVARQRGAYFHTDAVQALGKLDFDVGELGIDAASFSAHKLYGPKGVGALYLKRGTPFQPRLVGGGQESRRRSGTQNVPGIVGFAKALELMDASRTEEAERLTQLRDRLVDTVLALPNTQLNGTRDALAPHIVNLVIKGVEGEAMLLQLDNLGISVSTGSACSSGSLEPSHVLLSIGCPPEVAHGSLRLSLGRLTTEEDIDYFIEVFPPIVERLRAMSPVYERMFGAR